MRLVAPMLVFCALAASSALADDVRIVVLVRHAERAAAPSDDPGLSQAGKARAEALADALADARVDAIITTQFARTKATAEPLARARRLTPSVVTGGADTAVHAREVAAAVKALAPGSLALVVGHSDTVPAIIAALGGPALDDLCDAEFATMFTLIVPSNGPPRLLRTTYGAPDPPMPADCGRTMKK